MKRFPAFLLVALAFAATASKVDSCSDYSLGNFDPNSVDFKQDIAPAIMSASSKDDFLERLTKNEKTAPLFKQFALMHTSASSQADNVTPDSPRIIAYQGKLLMGLTGNPHPADPALNNRVEFIEYNSEKKKYDFYLASFNTVPATIEKNPTLCMGCHQGHPNWESYNVWPGAYPRNTEYLVRLANRGNGQYIGGEQRLKGIYKRFDYAPSQTALASTEILGAAIGYTSYVDLASRIKALPDFESLKIPLIASLIACPGMERFGPDFRGVDLGQQVTTLQQASLKANKDIHAAFNKMKLTNESVSESNDGPYDYFDSAQWARLDILLSSRGISIANFFS